MLWHFDIFWWRFQTGSSGNGVSFGGFWSGQVTLSRCSSCILADKQHPTSECCEGVVLEGRGLCWCQRDEAKFPRSHLETLETLEAKNGSSFAACCSTWWMNLLCWRGTSLTSIMVQSKGMWRVCWWRNCNKEKFSLEDTSWPNLRMLNKHKQTI